MAKGTVFKKDPKPTKQCTTTVVQNSAEPFGMYNDLDHYYGKLQTFLLGCLCLTLICWTYLSNYVFPFDKMSDNIYLLYFMRIFAQ